MKKLLIITSVCVSTFLVQAQDNTLTLENAMNEQFGTLLENLIVDGEINEADARIYLETVFGYNEDVSRYLQASNLSEQLQGLVKGNVSTESYLNTLNNSLINLVPAQYQREIQENLQVQALINGSIQEIVSGEVGANSYQLIEGIIQGIQEIKKDIAREKLLLEKIKAITPKLNSLQKSSYTKKTKFEVPMNPENWRENMNPDWSQKFNRLNKMSITENGIEGFGEWQNFAPPTYQFVKYFKNPDKFDFSKDFRAEFEISVDNTNTYNFFEIQLAGMYQMQLMCYQAKNTKAFTIVTPKEYFLTNKYGVFYNTRYNGVGGYHSTIIRNKNNPCVDYSKPIKIVMEKKGNQLTYQFNDCPETVSIEMDYFYNKYLLEFKFAGKVIIHRMTIEHL